MTFNEPPTRQTPSFLNEPPEKEPPEKAARDCATGLIGLDELPTSVNSSRGMSKSVNHEIIPHDPTHFRYAQLVEDVDDRFCSQGSPLTSPFLPSPSPNDQPQRLYRRNNRHRKANSSQSGKENLPPLPPVVCHSGRTYTAKTRRPVLANITNASQGDFESFEDVPFASSTSIQSPSRKVGQGEPGMTGLKIEPGHKPFLPTNDSQETIVAHDAFADRLPQLGPESSPASPSTPLREALAVFNDMFSSTFTSTSKKSMTTNASPNTFRLSLRLPSSPLPRGISISNAFTLSTLADSLSQLTGDITASMAASSCKDDYVYQAQYHEGAVARDERFHWEEEMRSLEIQCGLHDEAE